MTQIQQKILCSGLSQDNLQRFFFGYREDNAFVWLVLISSTDCVVDTLLTCTLQEINCPGRLKRSPSFPFTSSLRTRSSRPPFPSEPISNFIPGNTNPLPSSANVGPNILPTLALVNGCSREYRSWVSKVKVTLEEARDGKDINVKVCDGWGK